MSNKPLIGIDLGTSVVKVCAFDAKTGRLLGSAARGIETDTFPGGGREQKLSALDRAFHVALNELKAQLGDNWRNVEGIGLAAQGGSSIIADRATGRPHTPMILWNDTRANAYSERVASLFPKHFWRRVTLRDVPPAGLGRLLWLRERKPKLFSGANIHIGAGEYLFHKLTGLWRQDAGNAIQIGSYNAATMRLDDEALRHIGIPLSFFASLRSGHETAPLSRNGAYLLGLPEDVPVAGPYIDQEAGYLSAVGACRRPLQCSLGTAWVGNFVLPDNSPGHSPFQLVLPAPTGEGSLVIQPLLTGNVAWDAALDMFVGGHDPKALEKAEAIMADSLLPHPGLVAVPWFNQPNPINKQFHGAGVFSGVGPDTTPQDLLRAFAAGMTFELARVFAEVKETKVIDGIVLGGGAARAQFFRSPIPTLFAPLPVFWQTDQGLSVARGAVFAFNPKAAQSPTRQVKMLPGRVAADVRRRFLHYCATFERYFGSIPAGEAFHLGKRRGKL